MSREATAKDQPPGIERILFTEEQIAQRIQEVAAEISERYRGKPLKLVGVLKVCRCQVELRKLAI